MTANEYMRLLILNDWVYHFDDDPRECLSDNPKALEFVLRHEHLTDNHSDPCALFYEVSEQLATEWLVSLKAKNYLSLTEHEIIINANIPKDDVTRYINIIDNANLDPYHLANEVLINDIYRIH